MIQSAFTPDYYVGTGLLTDYAFTFRILRKADILVQTKTSGGTVTDLVLDTDYTIANAYVNNPAGGQLVLATALESGTELFLTRQTALTQLVHLEEGAPIPSSVFEEVFDRLTMMAQELTYLARKALHFPTTSTVVDVVLAPADISAVVTHGLNDSNAKIIGFSSTFHTAFKVVSQTANDITVGLTDEAPAAGGTLTFEVAI